MTPAGAAVAALAFATVAAPAPLTESVKLIATRAVKAALRSTFLAAHTRYASAKVKDPLEGDKGKRVYCYAPGP